MGPCGNVKTSSNLWMLTCGCGEVRTFFDDEFLRIPAHHEHLGAWKESVARGVDVDWFKEKLCKCGGM